MSRRGAVRQFTVTNEAVLVVIVARGIRSGRAKAALISRLKKDEKSYK